MTSLILLFIASALVNNVVLSRFLGICPFMGVSKSFGTAFGMSLSVAFVMMVASTLTWMLSYFLLVPYGLEYLTTVAFILIIASAVQFVEMALEKLLPDLHAGLGIFLPLITTNCAVLGVALLNIQNSYTFIEMLVFSLGSALGFGLALVLFAGLRSRLEFSSIPKYFKGMPIAFITAGILALAFMGFSGMVK